MKLHNLVYCKHHENDTRAYLYELPLGEAVKTGDKLCVEDRFGEHIIPAFCENFFADDRVTELVCVANGGYFPPAKVIGVVETKTITVSQEIVKKFGEEEVMPF